MYFMFSFLRTLVFDLFYDIVVSNKQRSSDGSRVKASCQWNESRRGDTREIRMSVSETGTRPQSNLTKKTPTELCEWV